MSNLGKKINPLELISREGFALSQIPALAGINVALSLISLNPALMVSFAAGSGAFLALQIRRKQIWREAIRAGKLIEEIQRAAERYLRHLSIINTNLTKGIPIKESLAVVAKDINSLKSDFDRLIAEWNSLNNSSARKKARINKVANRDQLQNNRAFLPKDAQLILNLEALSAQVLAAQTKISSAELEKEKITNPSKFYRDKLQTLEGKVTNSASPEEPKNLKDQISKLREEITAVSKFPIYANTAESQGLAGIISSSLLSDETVLRKILELEAKTKSAERLEEYKKKIREFRVKVLHFATLSKDEQDEKSSHIIDEYLELVRYLKIFSTDRQEGLLYSDQMDLKTYFNEQIQNDVFKTYLEPFLTSSDGTSTEASSSRLEIPTSKSVGAQVGEQQQTQETEFNPETAKTIVEKLLKQWSEIDGIDYLQNDEQIKWAWFWGVYEKLSTGDTRTSVERKVSEWAKNDGYLDGKYPEEQKQNMQLGEATRQVINAMLLNQQKINEGKQSSDEEVALRVTPVSTASSASVPPPPPPPPPPPSSRNQDTKPL